ncbi:MAG: MFS transporter [Rhodocyclaceae bacterium]|nr:MFS transporter [Rhodocyclaceae bacterium]MCE2980236.1 MFS transporter [Betaproteobacteria bacterium]MCA3075435.1 MFS transporter [Rhodocyclaceae bacterium]MCA3091920.1 MFS transporter [Rhodocyclaceae bacterium]MCA3093186.1 MFS transporter [Rhodocyclaceae bacterium]
MTALPINILLPAFYNARTGLSLSVIGVVFFLTRLIDAVVDPLLGAWVDVQKQRASYLPPVLIGAPVLAIGFALLLVPPAGMGEVASAGWLAATLATAYIGYSLAIVAYQAWGSELANDDAGRARITGAREGAGLVGVLAGAVLPQVIGMAAMVAVFLAALGATVYLLARCAPRPSPAGVPAAGPRSNPFSAFVVPLASGRFRWLLLVFALNAIAPSITATVFQFFVADRLGLAGYVPAFLALYFIAGAVSMPLWMKLATRFSLHVVWLAGMVAAVAAFVWAYWLDAGAVWGFAAICVLSGFAFGADLALPPALLARVIDANGHGSQREGAYFGLWNFVNKLTLAVAGGIALPLLEGLGYVAGSQDAIALSALAFTYAIVPCALKLVAAALLWSAWRNARF